MKGKLTMLAVLVALFACPAGAASAAQFHSEVSSTTLTGTQIGDDQFQFDYGLMECEGAAYSGGLSATTSTTVLLTPAYTLCSGFFPATVDINGCSYGLHPISKLSSSTFLGDFSVNCPAGQEITVTYISGGTLKCTVHIPPQTHKSTYVSHNEGAGSGREIRFQVELKNLEYRETAGFGVGACKTAPLQFDGSTLGQFRLKGEEGAIQKGVWVS